MAFMYSLTMQSEAGKSQENETKSVARESTGKVWKKFRKNYKKYNMQILHRLRNHPHYICLHQEQ